MEVHREKIDFHLVSHSYSQLSASSEHNQEDGVKEGRPYREGYGCDRDRRGGTTRRNAWSPYPSGEEAVYVLEGATLGLPDGKEIPFPTGVATLNARDVPHAGFKVVGDKTLKMLTVHIVDKGKPVTEFVK